MRLVQFALPKGSSKRERIVLDEQLRREQAKAIFDLLADQ